MTLFLDTPRADGGLNHRFFVSSPNDCNEAIIREYAIKARENVIGRDYLAASRTVHQVSRGQVRDGSELLVLSGISTKDPGINNMILKRLHEMLNLILDAPIPVGTPSVGLLVANQQIERFELEMIKEYSMVAELNYSPIHRPSHSGRKRFGFRRILVMISVVSIAVLFPLLIKSLAGKGNRGSDNGTADQEQESGNQKNGQAIEDTDGWKFLKDEKNWKSLAQLTGLKPEWTVIDAKTWASNLIRETNPARLALFEGVTPEEFQANQNIRDLLSAVVSNTDIDNNPDSISSEWLNRKQNDGSKLSEFWMDLKKLDSARVVSAVSLKNLLRAWEQAIPPDSLSTGHAVETKPKLQQKQPIEILILVESDLDRFTKIENYLLNNQQFLNSLKKANITDWTNNDWLSRLRSIPGITKTKSLKSECKEIIELLNKALDER